MQKIILSVTIFISFAHCAFSQYNVDWGKYMNDPLPNSDFSKEDESEQLVVDVKNAATNEEYVYVTGRTNARNDHEFSCAQNEFYFGAEDDFLAKYDKCGNLQWFRFLGSDNDNINHECGDFADCLAIDKDPVTDSTYIYVGGYSYSNYDASGCPSCLPCGSINSVKAFSCKGDTCVFQKNKKSEIDAFVAKYDEKGNLIKWTYFGGDGNDYIIGMSIFHHDVFITGTTSSSPGFIPSPTPKFDSTLSTNSDAFVAQLDDDLCNIKFFSYMGGPTYERTHAIKCFKTAGNPGQIEFYISGATEGNLADTSYHALNSYKGGLDDAFLSLWKLNKTTGVFKPQWLQYIGGKVDDRDREMIIDKSNNAIVTGFTQSKNFISGATWTYPKSNFYDTTFNGIKDVFVAKFDLAGNALWGTYFGGTQSDEARGIARYSITGGTTTNYIAFSGGTKSTDFPLQPLHPPFEATMNGGTSNTARDAFVAILTDPQSSAQVQQLEFSSYFGGKKDEWNDAITDYGPDLELGGNNELYLTFYSRSTDIENYISSPGYHHNSNSGTDNDAFLAKILNSNITNQFNCASFDWGTNNPLRTGSTEISDGKIKVYPNPATDQLTIDISDDGRVNYKVFNILGEELIAGNWNTLDGSDKLIDISSLPSSIYILNCEVNDQSFFQKFIVTK